jgi:hypothetical protein
LVAANGLIDVARGELVQLLVVAEDDDGDIDGAEDGQLMGLFEQAAFALQKSAGRSGSARALWAWGLATHTERLRSSLMALISIFLRPMVESGGGYGRLGMEGGRWALDRRAGATGRGVAGGWRRQGSSGQHWRARYMWAGVRGLQMQMHSVEALWRGRERAIRRGRARPKFRRQQDVGVGVGVDVDGGRKARARAQQAQEAERRLIRTARPRPARALAAPSAGNFCDAS